MQKKHILTLLFIATIYLVFAQAPGEISYQAVVRDGAGVNVQNNTPVQFIFTIHDLTASGPVVFTETTGVILANQFGLCITSIGKMASLSAVDWSGGNKYLQVQVRISNGTFVDMGTSQLLSMPYALYAGTAGAAATITGGNGSTQSNNYVVKFNGIPISDSTINHVSMACFGSSAYCLTNYNYWYSIYRGINSISSLASYTILADDTLSSNPTLYAYSAPLNCSSALYPYSGQVIAVNTNHTSGIYYVPLSATGTLVGSPLYQYNCTTNHWQVWNMQLFQNYRYYQLLANNTAITGFNLSFPLTVTFAR